MKEVFDACKNVELIFEGGQKKVYKGLHPKYGSVVLKTGAITAGVALERINREVNFLRETTSPYFPKNFEFFVDDKRKEFLIVEEYIESRKVNELPNFYWTEERIMDLLNELVQGLRTIWDQNIVHRDLKPDNILITSEFKPKIIDLGIARFIEYNSLTKSIALWGPCTPIYASPEQLLNKKKLINMRTDFFSLGIVLLELHLGFHPFHPDKVGNNKSIPENIVIGNYVSPLYKDGTSKPVANLIQKMLKTELFERFTNYSQILSHIKQHWS